MQKAIISDIATQKVSCAEPLPLPCGIAIFGASGDLATRKLIPALFNLMRNELLPEQWYVVGLGAR
jgi:glucose-6-phosphate 1-dehydrogenase